MKKQLSEAQLNANRANAKKSTGPKTIEGKTRSSMNSYKHGITARRVVLDNEDHDQFERLLNDYRSRFQPADGYELRVVDDLCVLHWHINRLQFIETVALQFEVYRPDFTAGMENIDPRLNPMLSFRRLVETIPGFLSTLNLQLNRLSREYERFANVFLKMRKECPPIAPAEPQAETPEAPAAQQPEATAPMVENEPTYGPTLERRMLFTQKPIFKRHGLKALAA